MALVLLAQVLIGVALAAGDGRAAQAECASCGGTGRVPCSAHRPAEVALESNALLCNFYAGCTHCDGTGRVDCPSCAPEAVPGAELRDKTRKRFLAYTEAVQHPVLCAASAHFNVACDLEPMKAQGKKRTRHELAHLYLDRLEEVYRTYLRLFELQDSDITARSEVLLWSKKEDHTRAGQTFCGYTTDDPEYMRGLEAIASLLVDTRKMPDDAALHRNVVHHVVHGLMNVQDPVGYTGRLHMGWADEGLSLWFEDRLLGSNTGYCFWIEEETPAWRERAWRPAIKKRLAPGTPLDFETFLSTDTIAMTVEEHALGFALVDYLATRGLSLLNRLLARMRARTPSRDAFKEVYGLSLEEVESAWRAWVAETYPKR